MSIPLISLIKPYNNGLFPVYEDIDGYGGYQVQPTMAAMQNIPINNLKIGMLVFVQDLKTFYQLASIVPMIWNPFIINGSGNPITNPPTTTPINGTLFVRNDGNSGSTGLYTYQNGSWYAIGTEISGSAGGDLSGSYPNPTVSSINGSTVPASSDGYSAGNVLQVGLFSNELNYAPINLGNSNSITGMLGIANGGTGTTQGWYVPGITTITSNYSVALSDALISANTASNAITINLQPASQLRAGRMLIIKNSDGNAGTNSITVSAYSGTTIDNNSTYLIDQPYASLTIVYTGNNNWGVV